VFGHFKLIDGKLCIRIVYETAETQSRSYFMIVIISRKVVESVLTVFSFIYILFLVKIYFVITTVPYAISTFTTL